MTTLLQAPQIMSTIAYIYHDTLAYQNIMAMAEVLKGDRIPECHRPAAEERQVLSQPASRALPVLHGSWDSDSNQDLDRK